MQRSQPLPHPAAADAQLPTCPRPHPPGFEKPSAIQQKGIVPFTKGLDVIQQAQSGTGKTATFCAGILNNLDYGLVQCQCLVLAPTRELAQQIEKVMRALGDYLQVREETGGVGRRGG
jgi:superfamily II DNA/RNA helicase